MAVKQIYKRVKLGIKPVRVSLNEEVETPIVEKEPKPVTKKSNKKNKEEKQDEDMTTEQFNRAEALAMDINVPNQVKVVKKDRGLIERTESSKIILTEDNRQVLTD
jgi:hypothetical protein